MFKNFFGIIIIIIIISIINIIIIVVITKTYIHLCLYFQDMKTYITFFKMPSLGFKPLLLLLKKVEHGVYDEKKVI